MRRGEHARSLRQRSPVECEGNRAVWARTSILAAYLRAKVQRQNAAIAPLEIIQPIGR